MRSNPLYLSIPILLFYAGCSDDADDGGQSHGGRAGGGAASGGTSGGRHSGSGSAGMGGATVAGSGGADSAAGASGEGGSTGRLDDCSACVSGPILEVLSEHAHDLISSSSLLATHPSEAEMVGFLIAPGMSGADGTGVSAAFMTPIQRCSEPMMYEPYCEESRCSRLSCTGEGAGWTVRYWLEEPITTPSGSEFEEASVETRWADGADGVTFELSSKAKGPAELDLTVTGEGSMDPEALSASETFPALCPAGTLTFDITATPDGESAALTLLGVTIAEFDSSGELVATDACR